MVTVPETAIRASSTKVMTYKEEKICIETVRK
jgi:hypothetical protein